MKDSIKPFIVLIGLLVLWHAMVIAFDMSAYILPGPLEVANSMVENASLLWEHTLVTLSEMLLGLLLGVLLGIILALILVYFTALRPWLLPPLLITQAIPVFALAPILMLWFGYGLTSKVVMTILVIFFPVATCCYDGLRHTHQGWLDMAQTMGGNRFCHSSQYSLACGIACPGVRAASSRCGCTNWCRCRGMGWLQRWPWLSHASG